jgi:Cu-Zn family superoxide dismutase
MKNLSTREFNDRACQVFFRGISTLTCLLCIALLVVLSSCNTGNKRADDNEDATGGQQEKRNEERTAKATMEPASGSNVSGEVTFTERESGKVRIEVKVENLPPGEHAVHLHEHGDCSAADASSAGGHWNPTMKPHGKRGNGTAFHKGDIDNMKVGDDGKGKLTMTIEGWSIGGPDSTNIVGKSVIIHEKADDFTSQPSGNAGGRISCGVIKAG